MSRHLPNRQFENRIGIGKTRAAERLFLPAGGFGGGGLMKSQIK
ncbi:MAG: hypothetical protein ABMA02_12385 [Saprospiraceae bacterium]